MTDIHSQWHPLCPLDDLADGRFHEARIQNTEIFTFLYDGKPRAYINRCPHRGITLNWSPGRFLDSSGQFIQCATHGALFRPGDGACIAGPCQGDQLSPLLVRVDQELVWVSLAS